MTKGISFDSLLSKLSTKSLQELLSQNSIPYKSSAVKKELINDIVESALQTGIHAFVTGMDKDLMRATVDNLKTKDDKDHNSKAKFLKTINKFLDDHSLDKLLSSQPLSILKQYCELLEFDEEGEKSDVEYALKEEINVLGATMMFQNMNKEFLVKCCDAAEVKSSGMKDALVYRFLAEWAPYLAEQEEEVVKSKSKGKAKKSDRPALEKGIESDELYNHYYVEELAEFCAANGLKKSGSKRDLIKRVLAFLDGNESYADLRPKKAGEKKKRRRRAEGGPVLKKRKKKAPKEGEEDAESKPTKKSSKKSSEDSESKASTSKSSKKRKNEESDEEEEEETARPSKKKKASD